MIVAYALGLNSISNIDKANEISTSIRDQLGLFSTTTITHPDGGSACLAPLLGYVVYTTDTLKIAVFVLKP